MPRSSSDRTPRRERRRPRRTRGRLRDALAAHPDDPVAALAAWEPGQLALGRSLQARTRAIGQRSQVDGNVACR